MVLCESSTTLYIREKQAHSLKINAMKMFYGFCSAGQVYDAKTIYVTMSYKKILTHIVMQKLFLLLT